MFNYFKGRGKLDSINLIKLIATIMVAFLHCIIKFVTINGTSNPFFNLIWITLLPLFMFAAGFINSNPEKCGTIRKLGYRTLKNILTLLVPCLTFLLISCLVSRNNVYDSFKKFYLNPEMYLWFLWALFVIHLIFNFGLYLSVKFCGERIFSKFIPVLIEMSFALFLLVLIFSGKIDGKILGVKLIAYYSCFYCAGYLFNLLVNSSLMDKKVTNVVMYCFLGISIIYVLFVCIYFQSIYSFDDSSIKHLIIRISSSFASVYSFFYLIDLICRLECSRKISFFGRFSLQTYYLHIIFLRFINFSSNDALMEWLIAIGATTALVLIVALVLIAIYFIPFLHLLMFGKTYSFYKFEKKMPKIFQ